MADQLEILANVGEDKTPRKLEFEELHSVKDSIKSIMLMWNTNCYYVDCVSNTFIINGGRRFRINFGNAEVVYRRRNTMSMSVNGEGSASHRVSWIIGIKGIEEPHHMVLLVISEDGSEWKWANTL